MGADGPSHVRVTHSDFDVCKGCGMRAGLVGTLLAVAVTAAWLGAVRAQEPPTRVFGTVTIEGRPAPLGTRVQAVLGDRLCGEGVVRFVNEALPEGYVVDVAAATTTQGCGVNGARITFLVGGVRANETAVFEAGSFVRLDLTVSGPAATPSPGATPPPFGTAPASPSPQPSVAPTVPIFGTLIPTPTATGTASPAATATPADTATGTAPASPSPPLTDRITPTATATPPLSGTTFIPLPGPVRGDGSDDGENTALAWGVAAVLLLGAAGVVGYLVYRRGR
jgi:hypothetical protein